MNRRKKALMPFKSVASRLLFDLFSGSTRARGDGPSPHFPLRGRRRWKKVRSGFLAFAILLVSVAAFGQTNTPTQTPTNTPTITLTNTVTNTPVNTATVTPTSTATVTPTITPTPTKTPTVTPTQTPTVTPTRTPPPTAVNTPTSTPNNNIIQIGTGHQLMLHGAPLAITDVSNTTPIVITTGTNGLNAAGDWVQVVGVQGTTAANGIWQCQFVSSTVCGLKYSSGNAAWTTGGTLTVLGTNAVAAGEWRDLSKCDRAWVHTWAPSGATATVLIETSGQPLQGASPVNGPPTIATTFATITNPTAAGTRTNVTDLSWVRVNVSVYATPGPLIYSTLEGFRQGQRIY